MNSVLRGLSRPWCLGGQCAGGLEIRFQISSGLKFFRGEVHSLLPTLCLSSGPVQLLGEVGATTETVLPRSEVLNRVASGRNSSEAEGSEGVWDLVCLGDTL